MRNKKLEEILSKGLLVTESILLIIFLLWRFQYGMNRYFDIDEFAHLHWSHNVLVGLRPYTDFFYFLPPLYLYLLIPLFWITGKSVVILLLSRGLSFGIFLLVLGTLFILVKKIRNVQAALLSILILAFLPIPSDKWIEVRPDGVAMLFSLLGMLFLVKGIQKQKTKDFFFSGLFYAVSVLITPKILPLAIIGVIVAGVSSLLCRPPRGSQTLGLSGSSTFQEPIRSHGRCLYGLLSFISGGLIPVLITILLFISYGDIGKSFYLVTKVATDASKVLGSKFPIPPNFLFYPNDIYYGAPGYSLPWLVNLIIWSLAIIWGIVKLVSFLDKKDRKESLIEFLLAASFLASLIAFVWIFPLRHAQYLMPISIFIAFYFADFITTLTGGISGSSTSAREYPRGVPQAHSLSTSEESRSLPRHHPRCLYHLFFPLMALLIFFAGREMYDWKLRWPSLNLSYYSTLFKLIPDGEKVYDLTGETIFSPDGYYFCCIPYGQYEEVLGQKPDLERELRQNRVKFVYMQNEGRLSVLPRAQTAVIRKYYTIYPSGNPPFLLVAGALVGFEKENLEKEFDLIAGGKYLLIWNNKILTTSDLSWLVEIDGKKVAENPLNLSEGIHKITVSEKGMMKIMYSP